MASRLNSSWLADVEHELGRANGRGTPYRTILERLVRRRLACGEADVESIATTYEALLQHEPSRDAAGRFRLKHGSRGRRRAGAYYTPPELIELLLDHSIEWVLDRVTDPSQVRVADPACGSGRFLLAAARRIARRGVPMVDVVRLCIFGVDTDPIAVRLCREALARAVGCDARELTQLRRAD